MVTAYNLLTRKPVTAISSAVSLLMNGLTGGKFVEKPSLEKARQYIDDGRYLWNSGIFVFKVDRLIAQYRRYLPETARQLDRLDLVEFCNIEEVYAKVEAISIDYGILEKSDRVSVVPAGLEWSDLQLKLKY